MRHWCLEQWHATCHRVSSCLSRLSVGADCSMGKKATSERPFNSGKATNKSVISFVSRTNYRSKLVSKGLSFPPIPLAAPLWPWKRSSVPHGPSSVFAVFRESGRLVVEVVDGSLQHSPPTVHDSALASPVLEGDRGRQSGPLVPASRMEDAHGWQTAV